jgi:hypothetical protein
MRRLPGLAVLVFAALPACGGAEPPPKEPEPTNEPPEGPRESGMKVASELGSIDSKGVAKVFHDLNPAFEACQKQGVKRVELLAGEVKFFVRIGQDGRVKWTYFESSELGDRETERCMLDAVSGARWPKPDGGDAEVRYGMELPLLASRPPNEWSSDRIAAALGRHGDEAEKCRGGTSGRFHVTMYVGEGGKVIAVGAAPPNKEGEEKVDCIVKAMKDLKAPTPGSWPAKVSFDF